MALDASRAGSFSTVCPVNKAWQAGWPMVADFAHRDMSFAWAKSLRMMRGATQGIAGAAGFHAEPTIERGRTHVI